MPPTGLPSVASRYCKLEADEQQQKRRARVWEERGGEGARDGADACEDRWVCTRTQWRDPQLDDSGRLGSKLVQCLFNAEVPRR